MDRETTTHKIGDYEFHFWSKYKGGETRKTLALISSGEDMDEKSMQSILMNKVYEIGSILCPKVMQGDKEFKVDIADDLENEDYMKFFTLLMEEFTKVLLSDNKKKESK